MVSTGYDAERPSACGGDLAGARGRAEFVVLALNPQDARRRRNLPRGVPPVDRNPDQKQDLRRHAICRAKGAERAERETGEHERPVRAARAQPRGGRDDILRLADSAVVLPRRRPDSPEVEPERFQLEPFREETRRPMHDLRVHRAAVARMRMRDERGSGRGRRNAEECLQQARRARNFEGQEGRRGTLRHQNHVSMRGHYASGFARRAP